MFSETYRRASQYTRPVIISKRLENGSVLAGCATFIVLNADGWILTAAHVFQDMVASQRHAQEMTQYRAACQQIEQDNNLTGKQKKKANLPSAQEPSVDNKPFILVGYRWNRKHAVR